MVEGEFYNRVNTNTYFVAMGFFKAAVMILKMRYELRNGRETLSSLTYTLNLCVFVCSRICHAMICLRVHSIVQYSTKELLHYPSIEQYSQPKFIFVYDVGDNAVYKHIQVRDVPRCAGDFMVNESAIEIVPGQVSMPLPKAAIKAGLFLYDKQVSGLMGVCDIPMPVPGTGSGFKGSVTKRDKCRAVVEHFFPTETKEEQDMMIQRLSGGRSPDISMQECPEDIVDAVLKMDKDNAPYFKKVLKLASDMRDRHRAANKQKNSADDADTQTPMMMQAERPTKKAKTLADIPVAASSSSASSSSAAPAPAAAAAAAADAGVEPEVFAHDGMAGKWSSSTPDELKGLLPGNHSLPFVYLRAYPDKYVGIYLSILVAASNVTMSVFHMDSELLLKSATTTSPHIIV